MNRTLRRLASIAIVLMLLGLVPPGVAESQPLPADSPTFQGNFERTGAMPGPGPTHDRPLVEFWRVPIGQGAEASPALVNNVLYVGSPSGVLYAIDAGSGEIRWAMQTAGAISSTPTVVDGVIYVGGGNVFYAFDAATGRAIWWRQLDAPVVRSSAALVYNIVYVAASDFRSVPDRTSYIYGLRISDGAIVQQFPATVTAGGRIYRLTPASSPAVSGVRVLVGTVEGPVYVIHSLEGSIEWVAGTWSDRFSANTGIAESSAATPVIVAGANSDLAVYRAGDTIYTIDILNRRHSSYVFSIGTVVQQTSIGMGPRGYFDHGSSLAFLGGRYYLPIHGLVKIEAPATDSSWWIRQPDPVGYVSTPAVAFGGAFVAAGTHNGILLIYDGVLDATSAYTIGGSILSPPVISGNSLYLTTTAGFLIALGTESGSVYQNG